MVQDFITLIRTAHYLKCMNCLYLEFFHLLFSNIKVPWVTEIVDCETTDKGNCHNVKHGAPYQASYKLNTKWKLVTH
jgi:hypothetical protein